MRDPGGGVHPFTPQTMTHPRPRPRATGLGVALLVVVLAATCTGGLAFHAYPTVMPLPATFTQTTTAAGGKSAQVTNPSGVAVTIQPSAGGSSVVSEVALQLLQLGAARSMNAVMAGINATTLPWLRVRLPPLVNSSNSADGLPTPTGYLGAIAITVTDLSQQPR